MTLDQVRRRLLRDAKGHSVRGSSGVRGWSRKHGLSFTHVYEFLSGARGPTAAILTVLNLEWRVMPKKSAAPALVVIGETRGGSST